MCRVDISDEKSILYTEIWESWVYQNINVYACFRIEDTVSFNTEQPNTYSTIDVKIPQKLASYKGHLSRSVNVGG